jgi:hypothetical protein
MLEAIVGFLGKAAGSLVGPIWKIASGKVLRPSIKLTKAPKNILNHLKPSASQDHIRLLLGPPHRVVEAHWYYSFSDLLVQLEFWPNSGAKSIAIGLVGIERRHRFSVPDHDKPLGQLTLQDVRLDESTTVFNSSMRHQELAVTYRAGPPGAWTHLTFGVLDPNAPFCLYGSSFDWDRDLGALRSDPSTVLVNWAAVSESGDEVHFDWSMC